jgi:hypothetical protein
MEKEKTKDQGQIQDVFDDPMLGAVILFLFLMQLLNSQLTKNVCTC